MKGLIVGIDASLSSTGVVMGNVHRWQWRLFKSQNHGQRPLQRLERYARLANGIIEWLKPEDVGAVYIEGYAFSRHSQSVTGLYEFGGLLRYHLASVTPKIIEVAPSTLKRFATGKGNAKKDFVLACIRDRWGELFESDDVGDAFALFQFGLCHSGLKEASTKLMRECVEKVTA